MTVDEVIRTLVAHSPLTGEQVSAELGRSRGYISVTGGRGRSPELGTVADVADVAGVDVVLRDRATGADLGTVTPPRQAQRQG